MRSEQEVRRAIALYGDTVQRLCLVHLKNEQDSQDIFQNVFLKYALHSPAFQSEEHEKAWLIRVTLNECRDLLRSFHRRSVPLEENIPAPEPHREVLAAVLALPEPYRQAIYLHYYEGYTAREIGELLYRRENTVYSHLQRGRALLRRTLGEGGDHGNEDPRRL